MEIQVRDGNKIRVQDIDTRKCHCYCGYLRTYDYFTESPTYCCNMYGVTLAGAKFRCDECMRENK